MKDLVDHGKEFGFYFKYDEMPLEGFGLRNIIWILFQKDDCGLTVDNGPYGARVDMRRYAKWLQK